MENKSLYYNSKLNNDNKLHYNKNLLKAREEYARIAERRYYRRAFEVFAIITLISVIILRLFVLNVTTVSGWSMYPTLINGEKILTLKVAYKISKPKRYDVVVCAFPGEDSLYVKRIIGLPGETIQLTKDSILIDGVPLEDDEYGRGINPRLQTVTIPEGHYFLMGDNRTQSNDSSRLGALSKENIKGKVCMIVWSSYGLKVL